MGRKALRRCHKNGVEVRKKRPGGFKKGAQGVQVSPLSPRSVAPWRMPSIQLAFLYAKLSTQVSVLQYLQLKV